MDHLAEALLTTGDSHACEPMLSMYIHTDMHVGRLTIPVSKLHSVDATHVIYHRVATVLAQSADRIKSAAHLPASIGIGAAMVLYLPSYMRSAAQRSQANSRGQIARIQRQERMQRRRLGPCSSGACPRRPSWSGPCLRRISVINS